MYTSCIHYFHGHMHQFVRTVTSQNIDHERARRHSEKSLLVQHFDNLQNRTNLFVIISYLALIKTNQYQNNC